MQRWPTTLPPTWRPVDLGAWIAPESIRPGEGWVDAINRGLKESTDVVVLLTPAAVESMWVRQEVSAAIALERRGQLRVIPLEVEPCEEVPPLWEAYQKIPLAPDYKWGVAQLIETLTGKMRRGIRGRRHPSRPAASGQSGVSGTVLDDLDAYARLYDSLHPRLPRELRNFVLNAVIVDQLFRLGSVRKFTAATVTGLFARGKDGDRMVALLLLQTAPTAQCLEIAIDAIESPRSPFEQYHGLRAVDLMTHILGDAERRRLTHVLEAARRRYLIPANQSRWEAYEDILAKLAARAGARTVGRGQRIEPKRSATRSR